MKVNVELNGLPSKPKTTMEDMEPGDWAEIIESPQQKNVGKIVWKGVNMNGKVTIYDMTSNSKGMHWDSMAAPYHIVRILKAGESITIEVR